MKDQRILVTGGAGFIGSHIVGELLESGYAVHVLDNLSVGKRENVPAGSRFFEGDILDPRVVSQALDGVDAVLHLAARVAIRDSLEHFYEDAQTNLMGTLNLLHHCGKSKIRKLIFASSMAVYGNSEEPKPIPESYVQRPISPYGLSKLAAEQYVLVLSRQLQMRCVSLRYFNVYGPRQSFTPYVGVITIFIQRLLRGMPPVIFGDGDQQRDFVYVGDIARASVLALESDLDGEVLNVGTGVGTSVNQIAQLLIQHLGLQAKPVYREPHPGEIRHSIADISRIRRLLGFHPRTAFSEKIREVIGWNRENALPHVG